MAICRFVFKGGMIGPTGLVSVDQDAIALVDVFAIRLLASTYRVLVADAKALTIKSLRPLRFGATTLVAILL